MKPRVAHPADRASAVEGCRLDPGVALWARACSHVVRVRWCPSLRRLDTWMPPCPAHLLATDIRTKIPSASPPHQPVPLLPRCALCRASARSLYRRAEPSPPSLPPCAGPRCFYAIHIYKRRPPLHLVRTSTVSTSGKPSPLHPPMFSTASSVPSRLTPPLSPYVGPRASPEPRATPQPEGLAPSPPLSSGAVDRIGEFRPSVARLPRFELGLSIVSGECTMG
jgi:hypothetical protein